MALRPATQSSCCYSCFLASNIMQLTRTQHAVSSGPKSIATALPCALAVRPVSTTCSHHHHHHRLRTTIKLMRALGDWTDSASASRVPNTWHPPAYSPTNSLTGSSSWGACTRSRSPAHEGDEGIVVSALHTSKSLGATPKHCNLKGFYVAANFSLQK